MKLLFENGTLKVTPESDTDKDELQRVTGGFEDTLDTRGYREAKIPYGYAVYLADDGISSVFRIKNVWWNRD